MKNTKHGITSRIIEYIVASTILGLPCVFSVPIIVERTNTAIGIVLTAIMFLLLARFQLGKIDFSVEIRSPSEFLIGAVLFSLSTVVSMSYFFHIGSLDSVDGPFLSTTVLYAMYQSCSSLIFGVSSGTATMLFIINRKSKSKQKGRTSEG